MNLVADVNLFMEGLLSSNPPFPLLIFMLVLSVYSNLQKVKNLLKLFHTGTQTSQLT